MKAEKGRLRPEQREYRALCEANGIRCGCGTYDAFVGFLVGIGYVRAEQFPNYRRKGA